MLSQNQNKQTKKMVEKNPLLRNKYERLPKVGSFITRLWKSSVGVKQPICVEDVGEFV
jgi:hypothetical protein